MRLLSINQCEESVKPVVVASDGKSVREYRRGQAGQDRAARHLYRKSGAALPGETDSVGPMDLACHIVGQIIGNACRLEQGAYGTGAQVSQSRAMHG